MNKEISTIEDRFPFQKEKTPWEKALESKVVFYPENSENRNDIENAYFTDKEKEVLASSYETAFTILTDYIDQERFLNETLSVWNGSISIPTEHVSGMPVSSYGVIELGVTQKGDIAQWYRGDISGDYMIFNHTVKYRDEYGDEVYEDTHTVRGSLPTIPCPPPDDVIPEVTALLTDLTQESVEVMKFPTSSLNFYYDEGGRGGLVDQRQMTLTNTSFKGVYANHTYTLGVDIYTNNKLKDISLSIEPEIIGNIDEYYDVQKKSELLSRLMKHAEQQTKLWKTVETFITGQPWMQEYYPPENAYHGTPFLVGYTHYGYPGRDQLSYGTYASYVKPGEYPGPPDSEFCRKENLQKDLEDPAIRELYETEYPEELDKYNLW